MDERSNMKGLVGICVSIAAAAVGLGGCGKSPPTRQCMTVGRTSEIVASAAVMRLEVYGTGSHCDGPRVAAGAGAPILSRVFGKGEPVRLDVPPGKKTLV